MAKKKPMYKLGDGSVLSIISENLDKHGKIKAKNKKQKKILVGSCVHHVLNKSGKTKARIKTVNDKCTCRMCGKKFRAGTYSNEELTKMIKPFEEAVNNYKFLSVAIGGGPQAVRYGAELGAMTNIFIDNYSKVRKVARKADSISKKKKKKKNNSESAALGSWR